MPIPGVAITKNVKGDLPTNSTASTSTVPHNLQLTYNPSVLIDSLNKSIIRTQLTVMPCLCLTQLTSTGITHGFLKGIVASRPRMWLQENKQTHSGHIPVRRFERRVKAKPRVITVNTSLSIYCYRCHTAFPNDSKFSPGFTKEDYRI